jgi:hypothetical protein
LANHLVTRLGVVLSLNRNSSEQISAKANSTQESSSNVPRRKRAKSICNFLQQSLVFGDYAKLDSHLPEWRPGILGASNAECADPVNCINDPLLPHKSGTGRLDWLKIHGLSRFF